MESHDRSSDKNESQDSIETPELLQSIRHGQELMHKLHQSGKSDSMAYKQLSSLLISPDGATWKTPHEIPEGLLLGTLGSIEKQEAHDEGTSEMIRIANSNDLSSPRYKKLYTLLTDDGRIKPVLDIDQEAIRAVLDEADPEVIDSELIEIPDPNESEEAGDLEDFLAKHDIGMLDRTMPIPRTAEGRAAAVNELRSLDPSTPIKMYHGLNGGLGKALEVITSPAGGVEQRSGPTLALWPVMQFWKPGDAGFEYELNRSDIQFPGEHNPDAIAEIREDGVIYLINGHTTLPLKNFNGRVLYTDVRGEDTDPGYDAWGIELPRWSGYRPLSENDMANAQEISKILNQN